MMLASKLKPSASASSDVKEDEEGEKGDDQEREKEEKDDFASKSIGERLCRGWRRADRQLELTSEND